MKLNLNYNEFDGDGNKVYIFLHGWGMNSVCFNNIISGLDDFKKIISLDFFGFGRSSVPDLFFDTYEYAYYVFCVICKLGLDTCDIIVVGHSFGGRVAILLSSVFDLRISNLVLIASAGVNLFDIKKWLKISRYKLCKKLVNAKLLNEKYLDKFGSSDYKSCSENMRKVFVNVVSQDLQKHLKKTSAFVSLIWDKRDKETPYRICKILHNNFDKSNILLLENGKHFAFLCNKYKIINYLNNMKY